MHTLNQEKHPHGKRSSGNNKPNSIRCKTEPGKLMPSNIGFRQSISKIEGQGEIKREAMPNKAQLLKEPYPLWWSKGVYHSWSYIKRSVSIKKTG